MSEKEKCPTGPVLPRDEIAAALRKERAVLRKDPDADQARIAELTLEIRRRRAMRFLQKRQMES